MKGKTERFKVAQVAEALRRTAGLASAAAEVLRCDPSTIRGYMRRHPQLRQIAEETVETMMDLAESKLYAAINGGDDWAVKFYLETKGKGRGYTRRTELTGNAGGPIDVTPDASARQWLERQFDDMAERIGHEPGGEAGEPRPGDPRPPDPPSVH